MYARNICALIGVFALIACGSPAQSPVVAQPPAQVPDDTKLVSISGSSTVYPLTLRLSRAMEATGAPVSFQIANVGTGGGFRAFCSNQGVDIVNASRAITPAEQQSCVENGRTPISFRIAYDALAIAVSRDNAFVQALSIAQLDQIFSGTARTWRDIDASYPAEPITLFSPGKDSGTADYFAEVIFAGQADRLATTATTSEDDTVLVNGLAANPNAIGYFGYAYYQYDSARLRAIPIKRTVSDAAVTPNRETATDLSYPLVRPLFIYSDTRTLREKPEVGQFLSFYLDNVNRYIDDVGYFPEKREALQQAQQTLDSARR